MRTNSVGTTTVSWEYDGLNRLVEEDFDGYDGQGDALAYVDTYSFDLSSNRTKLVHDDQTSGGGGSAGPDSTTTYEYDANDRLLAETRDVAGSTAEDRHTVYGYSPTDQTSKTVHEGLDDQGAVAQDIDFIYDATGRMTGVSMAVGSTTTTVSYKYDHNGFRVEATVDDGTNPPVTTIFHVDPANPTGYAQVVEQGVDADSDGRLDASEIEKAFVIGLDLLTQATASALLHLLTDAHGSTKSVLNAATSSVVERYVYSAYGQDLGLGSSPATSFRYAGEFIDPITGLSFNRARWYDPASGRLNSLDPFAGSRSVPLTYHRYLYAHASPIQLYDPDGRFAYADVLSSTAIQGYLRATYTYAINQARNKIAVRLITAIAKNIAEYQIITKQIDDTLEELALLVVDLAGLDLSAIAPVVRLLDNARDTFKFISTAVDVSVLRTVVLPLLSGIEGVTGDIAEFVGTALRYWGRGVFVFKALAAWALVPYAVRGIGGALSAVGYPTETRTDGWADSAAVLIDLALAGILPHGFKAAGFTAISVPAILQETRAVVRMVRQHNGFNHSADTAVRVLLDQLKYLFGDRIVINTHF